jgi:hypothetical protein
VTYGIQVQAVGIQRMLGELAEGRRGAGWALWRRIHENANGDDLDVLLFREGGRMFPSR